MPNIILSDPALLAVALKATTGSDPKRKVELDRCPKCNMPIAHYRDEQNWQADKYWHLGGKNYPCDRLLAQ